MPHLVVCNGRAFAMLTEGDGAAAPWLAEIKNPKFTVDADDVSQADKLNGIDWHGTVDMKWDAYRLFDRGRWTQWLDGGGDFEHSVASTESVFINHTNGRWMHDSDYSGQRDFAGMPRKPISCGTLPGG